MLLFTRSSIHTRALRRAMSSLTSGLTCSNVGAGYARSRRSTSGSGTKEEIVEEEPVVELPEGEEGELEAGADEGEADDEGGDAGDDAGSDDEQS